MNIAPDLSFALDDRYADTDGEVLVTGIQALARLPMDQMRADRRAGWRTAGYVSGYQGSPLGGLDRELLANAAILKELDIVHRPGLNEELAATSIVGSQLAATVATAKFDGVVGYWYGKAPGLERAADAIRHGIFVGTAARGGVLAMIGDDPACKSSTVPSRSDSLVAALGFPLLEPGSMQDVLDLGRHGVEMSRACGMWVGMRVVTPVADASGIASVDPGRLSPVVPVLERDGGIWSPMLSGDVLAPNSLLQEAELFGPRLELASCYIEQNRLNHDVVSSRSPWLTIVASGYTARVVVAALQQLGLDPATAGQLGVRVLKLGALYPFDKSTVRAASHDVGTVLVVEDKRPFIETLVRDALYSSVNRPDVIGKQDAEGNDLIPAAGALGADILVEPLRRVLRARIGEERLNPPRRRTPLALTLRPDAVRTAYFCPGCPHNTSTVVPDGSLVGVGIGCHGMVGQIDQANRGELIGVSQMGGEGGHWIGMAPFVDTPHVFQNIGDGTFFHSGQLAVQAAVAAGVSITFKLLYNSAVAMTGGQDATGQLAVPQVAAKLMAEGVRRIIITTDEPAKYKRAKLPAGVSVWQRDRIVAAQEELRQVGGVTVLIHDQRCAAEKRRDRKRGLLPMPATRVVIDHRVCEGCGDCGVQSNCLSLEPIDTEYGRKTKIDQASCNIDRSCIKGDCPAFVTVTPAERAGRGIAQAAYPPVPEPVYRGPHEGITIRMPGIGGTGVVTVSQILLAAAKIDGLPASAVDQTGLSQKAGPVVSTVELGLPPAGRVHLLLAFDLLAAVTPANLEGLDPAWSQVTASTTIVPTGRMIGRVATSALDTAGYRAELDVRSDVGANCYLDVGRLATGLLGTTVTSNILLLGVAFQAGMLPVTAAALERAIEVNGVAVDANKDAFTWGRRWFVDRHLVEGLASDRGLGAVDTTGLEDLGSTELIELVAARRADLRAYQDDGYADRYLSVVRRCANAERTAGSDGNFAMIVAHQLYRVMAYKDEYEVARLLVEGRSRAEGALGGPVASITWNLHPPLLRAFGVDRKIRFKPWTRPGLVALARLKRLRGTPLDPFGRTPMRRAERHLVDEYTELVDSLVPLLGTDPDRAEGTASLVDMVRGFETVKQRTLAEYRSALADALATGDLGRTSGPSRTRLPPP